MSLMAFGGVRIVQLQHGLVGIAYEHRHVTGTVSDGVLHIDQLTMAAEHQH